MIRAKFYLIIVLSIVLLIFIISCNNKISIRNYNNESFISLNRDFYYKIPKEAIENYYSSSTVIYNWTKFTFNIDNFAKIKIYFQTEKQKVDFINNLNANFNYEIKKYFNLFNQEYNSESISGFKMKNYLALISHRDKKMGFKPVKEGWQKGYKWETINPFTDISLYFTYNNLIAYYNITIEYLPPLSSPAEASKKYYELQDKIFNVVNNIYHENEFKEKH